MSEQQKSTWRTKVGLAEMLKGRAKQRYRRRRGHRQDYTRLRIDEIVAG